MDTQEFWRVVDDTTVAKTPRGKANALIKRLKSTSPEFILSFRRELDKRLSESNIEDLWLAAMLIGDGSCSDDCFEYFRYWLIALGRDIFNKAISEPDSLASVSLSRRGDGMYPMNEDFGYAPAIAYESLTGKELHRDERDVTSQASNGETSLELLFEEISEDELQKRLPKLWEKHGRRYLDTLKQRELDRQDYEREVERWKQNIVDAPYFGRVSAGTRLLHKRKGTLAVEWVRLGEFGGPQVGVRIYETHVSNLPLSQDYFEKVGE